MASTGGTPFLLSPATGHAATAVFDVEAVGAGAGTGAQHRAAKSTPAPDAGAAFVLESKGTVRGALPCLPAHPRSIHLTHVAAADFAGTWWHAGFHLTTAIVGPTVLTLPYALRGMGWGLGLAALTAVFAVTFYAYYLVSRVLDHCEAAGRRHIRFRELAADVPGTHARSASADTGGHQLTKQAN